jgi:uncharacterized protein
MRIKFLGFILSLCLSLAMVVGFSFANAQNSKNVQLSSPIAGATGVPAGTGAGIHSPNSPFKPLPVRADVVAWAVLTDVKTKNIKGNIVPVFNAAQMALNQRSQRVQGFMMPLDPGEKQTHFLLSSVPLNCGFCTPGGPESMIEVRTKTGVKYSMEPVVVEGNFQVLVNDPFGVYYKIVDANPVK